MERFSVGVNDWFSWSTDTQPGSPALPLCWVTEFRFAKDSSLSAPNQEHAEVTSRYCLPFLPKLGTMSFSFLPWADNGDSSFPLKALEGFLKVVQYCSELFSRVFYVRWLVCSSWLCPWFVLHGFVF